MKLNLFSKKHKPSLSEHAAGFTAFERRSLETPGIPPAGLPYATYDQMERDPMIQTALTLKKLGVAAPSYSIKPANDSNEAKLRAEFVEKAFQRMVGSPKTILLAAMDAFAKGWSVQEIVWAFEDGFWWIDALRHKDPSNFGIQIDPFGRLTGLLLQLPGESEQKLDSSKFVVYANRDSYGRPKGRSDLDAAWRHWVIKTQLVAAWKLHLERFAMPTILGRFRRGLPASEISGLLSNLENLHKTSAVVFPNEIEIETLGGLKEPSTGFMEAIEFHNREIARSILGQTLTTDEGRRVGSLALGKVHLQVLLLQLEAVREDIADRVMNEQVIRPLCEYNFGPGLLPRFEFEAPSVSAFVTGAV